MVLDSNLSLCIVNASLKYLGRPFEWETFNCVHFVRDVYADVGIALPLLMRYGLPPREFHVSAEESLHMPIGHSLFVKRIAKETSRYWSHVVIILDQNHVIHNTRHMGKGVTITPFSEFLEVYVLSPCT